MKKNKVINISDIKIDLFVKNENNEDVIASLDSGDSVLSFGDVQTNSMRIFQRKNLVSIEIVDTNEVIDIVEGLDEEIKEDKKETLEDIEFVSVSDVLVKEENPYEELLALDLFYEDQDILELAKKQAEDYTSDSENLESTEDVLGVEVKEKKKYNYKKKPGRKKKRGPKPGSKRKTE